MTPTQQKAVVYFTLFACAALLTLFTFDTWETVLLVSLLLVITSYGIILTTDRLTPLDSGLDTALEGFTSQRATTGGAADSTRQEWLETDELFDAFYASIFTKLTQNENLIQAETAICLKEFAKDRPVSDLIVADIGCGIGIATCSLIKQGVKQAIGVDKSRAMLQYAKDTTLTGTTLSDSQKQAVEFRMADALGPGAMMGGECDAALILYFTVYYFGKQMDTLFRNLHLWVKPGGSLAIEVVNKYKFEPVLDSSNPWVGVSPQRYQKERMTRSQAVFDQFEYQGDFELQDPNAEFREVFRFKDGTVRRQRHRLTMPSIKEIIQMASENGWLYTKYVDLMPLTFSYGYLLFFTRKAD